MPQDARKKDKTNPETFADAAEKPSTGSEELIVPMKFSDNPKLDKEAKRLLAKLGFGFDEDGNEYHPLI